MLRWLAIARFMSTVATSFECGRVPLDDPLKSRVIGGHAPAEGNGPFLARIGYFCSGSIVGRRHVLTAAHCIGKRNASQITVYTDAILRHSLRREYFKVLLSHKDDWRDGNVDMECSFASQSLFERAFSELLFCKSMTVVCGVDNDDEEPSLPFLSLPAVRVCTSLEVFETPSPLLTAGEIIEWLNAEARSKEPKRFEMSGNELVNSVENLAQQLKTDFVESKLARRYVFWISVSGYHGQLGRFVNEDTSEELIITCSGTGIVTGHLEVVRKPVDDESYWWTPNSVITS